MAEFALKNDFFDFNNQIKPQISGTATETKCTPMYACIFMDKMEAESFWRHKQINHSAGFDILKKLFQIIFFL